MARTSVLTDHSSQEEGLRTRHVGNLWNIDPGKHYHRGDGVRTIVPAVFGDDELYRYVTSNLTRQPVPIDWSHEREWRWPNRDYRFVNIDNAEPEDAEARKLRDLREETRVDFHGLNLDEAGVRGVGLIVKNQNQADLLVRDILWLVDAGLVTPHLYRYILLLPVLKKRLSKIHQPAPPAHDQVSPIASTPISRPNPAIDKPSRQTQTDQQTDSIARLRERAGRVLRHSISLSAFQSNSS